MSGRGRIDEPRGPSEEEQRRRPETFPVKGRIEFGKVWKCGLCKGSGLAMMGLRKYDKKIKCPRCNGTGWETRREISDDPMAAHQVSDLG